MKRSSSQETLHNHNKGEHRKSRTLSNGFRKIFRTSRSTSKSYHSFSSSSTSLNVQIETGRTTKQPNPQRLCKSVSTFLIKYCHGCCPCCRCCCKNSATTDSPPQNVEQWHRSRHCWCCCCDTLRKGGRISTSEPPKASPPPPTTLSSIRVQLEEEAREPGDFDRDLRRRERRLRFKEEVQEAALVSNVDSSLMTVQKTQNGKYLERQRDEEEEEDISDSSATVTTEPGSVQSMCT
ncbi:hypothetical protein ACTXT7_010123 [Hymenolepis weldensis]